MHFLSCQPYKSRLEAPCKGRDFDLSTLNKALVVEGGSLNDKRHIIVINGVLLGCHHVAQCSRRSPNILELVIRVLYLAVHFLSTMQYGIGTQSCITTNRVSRRQALLMLSW